MRIGLIGRADPTGLGSMTIDFCAEMPVTKALIIERQDRGRTDAGLIDCPLKLLVGEICDQSLDWLLTDIDVLVGFETFYDDRVIPAAARRGVKTVMFPMWECSPDQVHACDVLFALSGTDAAKYPKAIDVRWPMRLLPGWRGWKPRNPPKQFLAIAGGLHDRNNYGHVGTATRDLVRALSSGSVGSSGDVAERWMIYDGADVMIHLQAFDGLSLPILEATACGIPVLVLDIPGFQDHPNSMRVRAAHQEVHEIAGRKVVYHRPDVDHLKQVVVELMAGIRTPDLGPKPATWDEFRAVWAEHLQEQSDGPDTQSPG